MAHVGIERLGARDGQEHGPEGAQACRPMGDEKEDAIGRVDGGQNARIVRNVKDAADRQRGEPHRRDRPEPGGDPAVPWLCTANRPIRITRLSGRTYGSKAGVTSLQPSTAESTEMAGVMMASP